MDEFTLIVAGRIREQSPVGWANFVQHEGHAARVAIRNAIEDLSDAGYVYIGPQGLVWIST